MDHVVRGAFVRVDGLHEQLQRNELIRLFCKYLLLSLLYLLAEVAKGESRSPSGFKITTSLYAHIAARLFNVSLPLLAT